MQLLIDRAAASVSTGQGQRTAGKATGNAKPQSKGKQTKGRATSSRPVRTSKTPPRSDAPDQRSTCARYSVRERQSMAASATATIDTTRPAIQPATSAATRIAPRAVPIPTTPAVATRRAKTDSKLRRSGCSDRNPPVSGVSRVVGSCEPASTYPTLPGPRFMSAELLTPVTTPPSALTWRPLDRSIETRTFSNGSAATTIRPTGMSKGSTGTFPPPS